MNAANPNPMRRWIFLSSLAAVLMLVLVGLVVMIARANAHSFGGLVTNPPAPAADFTLTDETGQPFTLSSLRGQWVLLVYGYTTCPDVCPATLTNLRQVKSQLGPAAAQVRVVFASVDPDRDSVDKMRDYVHHFGADFKGLTGTNAQVAVAAQAYGVKYEKSLTTSAVGYLVTHTSFVYLLDPRFQLRVTYPFGVGSPEITADIQYLMAQEKH
jgi:protein SCO1/2